MTMGEPTLLFLQVCGISVIALLLLLSGCASKDSSGTLASLEEVEVQVVDEQVHDSLTKAMASYEEFLRNTPETEMTPEALRRLADLKIQKDQADEEIGQVVIDAEEAAARVAPSLPEPRTDQADANQSPATDISAPLPLAVDQKPDQQESIAGADDSIATIDESDESFGERAGAPLDINRSSDALDTASLPAAEAGQDLQTAGAMEAIEIYKNLLQKYPLFERNDQVVYQLSRAYEETGQVDIAMDTLKVLIAEYPNSRHIDEAHFRLAEYYFSRKRYLDAEEAYIGIVNAGEGSEFYELALYKLGWSYFKQELYDEALKSFITMLDFKVDNGFELDNLESKIDKKRIDDTYRVISLSFSYLEGPRSISEFFTRYGHRSYEASIYSHLGEYYLSKRRFADATESYKTFVDQNPLSKQAPYFSIRIIEIYDKGGFPKLVIDSKKAFARTYRLNSEYWGYFDIKDHPSIYAYMKVNVIDLANHYHALYQNEKLKESKDENYQEAILWYREFLADFRQEPEAPGLHNQLAGLLLEHQDYFNAALEYELTAYSYPPHEDSANAGHAAVYSYREYLKQADQSEQFQIKREIVRSSIRFAETFPDHKQADVVLVAAVEDLYALEDFERAIIYGRQAIAVYPDADSKLLRAAWLVIAHSSFNIAAYADAEEAYTQTLALTDPKQDSYQTLTENLAASVYKQGEEALTLGDHQLAADHFLRVGRVAPNSKIRPTAEYDAATSLIVLKQWQNATTLLEGFRNRFPQSELLGDITKKLAVVYKEDGRLVKAAEEFERIEVENQGDEALRREALNQAADLYSKAEIPQRVLQIYQKLVDYFPDPIEDAIETRQKMADIYMAQGDRQAYLAQLRVIVDTDDKGGEGRTDRTRYLASLAALTLAEEKWQAFQSVALVQPIKNTLANKRNRMSEAIEAFTRLIDYQVSEVTAAATYYLAEIYYDFSVALFNSERPTDLNDEELELYELAIEEQAYPFEEKAIEVHEKNMELLDVQVYNQWIDKSLARLALLLPSRYAKSEEESVVIAQIQPLPEVESEPEPDATSRNADDDSAMIQEAVVDAPAGGE